MSKLDSVDKPIASGTENDTGQFQKRGQLPSKLQKSCQKQIVCTSSSQQSCNTASENSNFQVLQPLPQRKVDISSHRSNSTNFWQKESCELSESSESQSGFDFDQIEIQFDATRKESSD